MVYGHKSDALRKVIDHLGDSKLARELTDVLENRFE